MNVRGLILKKNILEKWAEISVAKVDIWSSLGRLFAKLCCLKCPEDISRGWTGSIVSLRSTTLISSHSPHNNWQDVLGRIATSKARLAHNSCLFPQHHALKRHLLLLGLVQRVKFTSLLRERPAQRQAWGSPGGGRCPGLPPAWHWSQPGLQDRHLLLWVSWVQPESSWAAVILGRARTPQSRLQAGWFLRWSQEKALPQPKWPQRGWDVNQW